MRLLRSVVVVAIVRVAILLLLLKVLLLLLLEMLLLVVMVVLVFAGGPAVASAHVVAGWKTGKGTRLKFGENSNLKTIKNPLVFFKGSTLTW